MSIFGHFFMTTEVCHTTAADGLTARWWTVYAHDGEYTQAKKDTRESEKNDVEEY